MTIEPIAREMLTEIVRGKATKHVEESKLALLFSIATSLKRIADKLDDMDKRLGAPE